MDSKRPSNNKNTLWIVGQYREEIHSGSVWDFQGVFNTYEKAKKACRNDTYFVFSATLNEELPDEQVKPPWCEYPIVGDDWKIDNGECKVQVAPTN